ncbi:MFS transporter [Haladaptatus sp. DYF46]|uniref:MFS transporter n=1 Tax=Haladaptatus sp. DYF46 TaxID=2886041 RepID=UPI001E2F78B8
MATDNADVEAGTERESDSFLDTWGTLVVVTIVMFVVSLDASMIPVAIEPISTDLRTSASGVQAALAIYSVVDAPLLLTGAGLGVLYGNKRIFRYGIVLFSIGTLIGALSPSLGIFVLGWSVIKAVADTMITPISLALLLATYDGKRRATAFSVWGAVTASAQAVGPLLMGFLATVATWRLAIGLESVGLLVAFALLFSVPETETEEEAAFDWGGTVLSFLSIGAVILSFLLAGQYGWVTPIRPLVVEGVRIAPFGLSVVPFVFGFGLVVLWGLIEWEQRRLSRGEAALFRPKLFTNRVYVTGLSIYGIYSVVTTGFGFVLPTFLAMAVGFDPLTIGIAFLPFAIAAILVSIGSGWVEGYLSPKHMIQISVALFVAGLLLLGYVLSPTVTVEAMVVPLAVFGAGAGLMRAPVSNMSLSSAGDEEGGEASGILETGKEFGRGIGNAVIGSIFLASLYGGIVDRVLHSTGIRVSTSERTRLIVALEDAAQTFNSPGNSAAAKELPNAVRGLLVEIVENSAVEAVQLALVIVVVFVLIQLLLSGFLPGTQRSENDE